MIAAAAVLVAARGIYATGSAASLRRPAVGAATTAGAYAGDTAFSRIAGHSLAGISLALAGAASRWASLALRGVLAQAVYTGARRLVPDTLVALAGRRWGRIADQRLAVATAGLATIRAGAGIAVRAAGTRRQPGRGPAVGIEPAGKGLPPTVGLLALVGQGAFLRATRPPAASLLAVLPGRTDHTDTIAIHTHVVLADLLRSATVIGAVLGVARPPHADLPGGALHHRAVGRTAAFVDADLPGRAVAAGASNGQTPTGGTTIIFRAFHVDTTGRLALAVTAHLAGQTGILLAVGRIAQAGRATLAGGAFHSHAAALGAGLVDADLPVTGTVL